MRFQDEPEPREGDVRTVKRFLFFPKSIGGETRWLEKATIRQWAHYYQGTSMVWWEDAEWVNS